MRVAARSESEIHMLCFEKAPPDRGWDTKLRSLLGAQVQGWGLLPLLDLPLWRLHRMGHAGERRAEHMS